jgi:hypothetical protein
MTRQETFKWVQMSDCPVEGKYLSLAQLFGTLNAEGHY